MSTAIYLTPQSSYVVKEWKSGDSPPSIPAGYGGISIHTRYSKANYGGRPPFPHNVGINDELLWHGWGRMVTFVPPGEHLVELRKDWPTGTRYVSAREGQITELEYVESNQREARRRGALSTPPGQTVGFHFSFQILSTLIILIVGLGLVYALGSVSVNMGHEVVNIAGLIAGTTVFGAVAVVTAKAIGAIARSRVHSALQRMAPAPQRVTKDGSHGYFLGLDPSGYPQLQRGRAGILIDATFHWPFGIDRSQVESDTPPQGYSLAWLPPPELTINGREHPMSWARWFFDVHPGSHTVQLRIPGPGQSIATVSGAVIASLDPGSLTEIVFDADLNCTVISEAGWESRDNLEYVGSMRTYTRRPKLAIHPESRVGGVSG